MSPRCLVLDYSEIIKNFSIDETAQLNVDGAPNGGGNNEVAFIAHALREDTAAGDDNSSNARGNINEVSGTSNVGGNNEVAFTAHALREDTAAVDDEPSNGSRNINKLAGTSNADEVAVAIVPQSGYVVIRSAPNKKGRKTAERSVRIWPKNEFRGKQMSEFLYFIIRQYSLVMCRIFKLKKNSMDNDGIKFRIFTQFSFPINETKCKIL